MSEVVVFPLGGEFALLSRALYIVIFPQTLTAPMPHRWQAFLPLASSITFEPSASIIVAVN